MTSEQALAVRRLLLVAAGLGATLVAHALCAGGIGIAPAAPAVWGSIACLAVLLAPRRRAPWRAWSAAGTLGRLLAVELTAHAAVTAAPWAFGVTVHHRPPLVSTSALVAHGVAAVVLVIVLLQAQRALGVLVRLVRRIRRVVTRRPTRPAWQLRLVATTTVLPARPRPRPAGARGPPLPAV
jgi:hypothetical protein